MQICRLLRFVCAPLKFSVSLEVYNILLKHTHARAKKKTFLLQSFENPRIPGGKNHPRKTGEIYMMERVIDMIAKSSAAATKKPKRGKRKVLLLSCF